MTSTAAAIANAAATIREVSPFLAEMWMTRPFHRRAVVNALFDKMRADQAKADPEYTDDPAGRLRVLLLRVLDLVDADRKVGEAKQK